MSRAFVKEDTGEQLGDLPPERPLSPYPNYMTPQGLATLQARLEELQQERHRLMERPDDLVGQDHLRVVERDLRYLQERVERAILIDPARQPADEVAFGATARVADEEDKEREFTIVGEDEADPATGRISWVSPLARALTGARVGETVTWKRPTGDVQLEIVGIRYEGAA